MKAYFFLSANREVYILEAEYGEKHRFQTTYPAMDVPVVFPRGEDALIDYMRWELAQKLNCNTTDIEVVKGEPPKPEPIAEAKPKKGKK